MDSERWGRLRELFDVALDLAASERPAFIEQSCEGDPELQRTLESLIENSEKAGSAFDQALVHAVCLEDSIPTNMNLLGSTIGHYRIIEKIGEGGMGEVFRAADTQLGREVAIKMLPESFTRDPERLARFDREARVLASLNHPNIATIHGVEEVNGVRYLVLELVEGATLREKLVSGALPVTSVVRLAVQIAEGLAKAHAAGVVHRDLKPDNLMVTDDGYIKILDFGLAKAAVEPVRGGPDLKTATGRVMGTASYMSPEQARGEKVDHRSDQFSFGSVLYEMATGARAFKEPSEAETLVAIMRSKPKQLEDRDTRMPGPVCRIIERCLAKVPGNRYESTKDLARDLRDLTERLNEISDIAAIEDRTPARETASIAVLPLENLSRGGEDYFADGMTDALITHLSKIEALKVISRMSVMSYKGARKPLPDIARELGVETVLTGAVVHAGDRVRISTQLIEAGTDRNLWADSYERDLDDILALQSEVARAIAGMVKVRVDPEEEARIAASRKIDPVAHDAYLRGLSDLEEAYLGGTNQRDLLRTAYGHFERSIEVEPEWAVPRGGLACSYRLTAGSGGPDVQAEFYPKAKTTALEALELDPTVARAHMVLGLTLAFHEWKWAEAEESFRRGKVLYPNIVNWPFAFFLTCVGSYDEAITHFTRAKERFPTSPLIPRQLGEAHLCAGRPEDAEAEAMRVIEAFPDSFHGYELLGLVCFSASRFEEAVKLFEKIRDEAVAWNPAAAAQELPLALARAGRVEDAQRILRELEAGAFDWYPELYWVLGEEDKAMAQIEAAFEDRRDIVLTIRCSPEYESFMENLRFREIIDAIGFPN